MEIVNYQELLQYDNYEIKEWVKGKYLFAFDLVKDKYIETFKKQESV